ncbi:hypothetical protein L1987_45196 [Smallanthus sonchifolius]|uniref:Uncharacterized protein n=1 Tax=Smallanthus sonchifolius TaxID=185202 RepID=A0ACB9GQY9_9ASTR|nr:hypothetical protein L1987_45196 [Smallanthus sonchifolius]
MMLTLKPTSKLVYLTIILLISPSFLINLTASEDSNDIEDLIAIDEEEYEQSSPKPSSEAQRIVVELNNDNTQKAIDGNEYVLVVGYAPWEDISAALMPRFEEAACCLNELKSPVLMAKIDAELYPQVAWNLGIKGYPTLLLFVNGTCQHYTGGLSSEEIMTFVWKKTGTPVIRINSIDEASNFLQKHSMFAVGLFDKFEGPNYEEFVKAATTDNEVQFVETSNSQIANILFPDVNSSTSSSPFLGIVKSEPERYTLYENAFEKDKILQFLNDNKFPLVTFLTELNSVKVYASDKLQIIFVFVDIKDENFAKPFLPLFGLEDSEDTLVAAFDNKTGARSSVTKRAVGSDWKDADILTIVGKTFDELVLRSSKNIILEIHTPWCLNCETTSKQVQKLAKHFKGLENLVFAKIDASVNEHPKLEIKLPTKSSSKDLAILINKYLKEQSHDEKHVAKDEL